MIFRVIAKECHQFPEIEEEFSSLRKAQLRASALRREQTYPVIRIEDEAGTLALWQLRGIAAPRWEREK